MLERRTFLQLVGGSIATAFLPIEILSKTLGEDNYALDGFSVIDSRKLACSRNPAKSRDMEDQFFLKGMFHSFIRKHPNDYPHVVREDWGEIKQYTYDGEEYSGHMTFFHITRQKWSDRLIGKNVLSKDRELFEEVKQSVANRERFTKLRNKSCQTT